MLKNRIVLQYLLIEYLLNYINIIKSLTIYFTGLLMEFSKSKNTSQ